jgi:hypothetical protein
MFRKRQAKPVEPKRVTLDSGGWADFAECESLWECEGEGLWRTPKGALVMRWAQRYSTFSQAGMKIRASVEEWRVDEVDAAFAEDLLEQRADEFPFTRIGKAAALARSRVFPPRPPDWDPAEKR